MKHETQWAPNSQMGHDIISDKLQIRAVLPRTMTFTKSSTTSDYYNTTIKQLSYVKTVVNDLWIDKLIQITLEESPRR